MKKFILILFFFASANAFSQVGSYAGSFARLGFGARGMGMGNAMVSNIFGDASGYYNPALACFQEKGVVNLGYTFLSQDRKLNFVGFSKKFKLPNQEKGGAGISFSLINSGVNNIDGRDNDGTQIGTFSTYENQFYLGTSFLLSENFAAGVGFKMYLSKLASSRAKRAPRGWPACSSCAAAPGTKRPANCWCWDRPAVCCSSRPKESLTPKRMPASLARGIVDRWKLRRAESTIRMVRIRSHAGCYDGDVDPVLGSTRTFLKNRRNKSGRP